MDEQNRISKSTGTLREDALNQMQSLSSFSSFEETSPRLRPSSSVLRIALEESESEECGLGTSNSPTRTVFHTPAQKADGSQELSPHVRSLVETLKFIESTPDHRKMAPQSTANGPTMSPTNSLSLSSSSKSVFKSSPSSSGRVQKTPDLQETPNSLYISASDTFTHGSPEIAVTAYGSFRQVESGGLMNSGHLSVDVKKQKDPDLDFEVDEIVYSPAVSEKKSPLKASRDKMEDTCDKRSQSSLSLQKSSRSSFRSESPSQLRSVLSSRESISKIPSFRQSTSTNTSPPRSPLTNPRSKSNSPKSTPKAGQGVRSHVLELVESLKSQDAQLPSTPPRMRPSQSEDVRLLSGNTDKFSSLNNSNNNAKSLERSFSARRNVVNMRITKTSPPTSPDLTASKRPAPQQKNTSLWKRIASGEHGRSSSAGSNSTFGRGREKSNSTSRAPSHQMQPSANSKPHSQRPQQQQQSNHHTSKVSTLAYNLQKMRLAGRKAVENLASSPHQKNKGKEGLAHTTSAPPKKSTEQLPTTEATPLETFHVEDTRKNYKEAAAAFLSLVPAKQNSRSFISRSRGNSGSSTSARRGKPSLMARSTPNLKSTKLILSEPSAQELRKQLDLLQEKFDKIIANSQKKDDVESKSQAKPAVKGNASGRRSILDYEKNITMHRGSSRAELRTKPGEFLFSSKINSMISWSGGVSGKRENLRTKSSSDLSMPAQVDSPLTATNSFRSQVSDASSQGVGSARRGLASKRIIGASSEKTRTYRRPLSQTKSDFRSKSMQVFSPYRNEQQGEAGNYLHANQKVRGVLPTRRPSAANSSRGSNSPPKRVTQSNQRSLPSKRPSARSIAKAFS